MNILNKICSHHHDIAIYISTFLFGNCNLCNKKTYCNNLFYKITVYKYCVIDPENNYIESQRILKKSVIYNLLCKCCYHNFLIKKYNMYIGE